MSPNKENCLSREYQELFDSHLSILQSHGPNVDKDILEAIVQVWKELRLADNHGTIEYSFSIHESVNIIKRFNAYPQDGIEGGMKNI